MIHPILYINNMTNVVLGEKKGGKELKKPKTAFEKDDIFASRSYCPKLILRLF